MEQAVEAGVVPGYAAAARALGITRARMTQIVNPFLLAPAIQKALLLGEITRSERTVRGLVGDCCPPRKD